MSEKVEIEYLLTLNTEACLSEIRKIETLLIRTMSLMQRMGLPEDVQQAVNTLQRLIMTMRALQVAATLVSVATGPIGWGMAAISVAAAVMTAGEFVGDVAYDNQRGK